MLAPLFVLWIVHLAATLTPGANTLLVIQFALSRDRRLARRVAWGVAAGSASWALFAVCGLNVIFAVIPNIRLALQIFGGLYLLWLSCKIALSAGAIVQSAPIEHARPKAFRLGLLTNFTNPKAALFFGSVFSACFPADPPAWLPVAAILIVFLNSLTWYSVLARLFSGTVMQSRYIAHCRLANRIAGGIFGILGASLLYRSIKEANALPT